MSWVGRFYVGLDWNIDIEVWIKCMWYKFGNNN